MPQNDSSTLLPVNKSTVKYIRSSLLLTQHRDSELSPAAKKVWEVVLYLTDSVGLTVSTCQTSIKQVAQLAGMARNTAKEHLDTLSCAGLVCKEIKRTVSGGVWSNKLFITMLRSEEHTSE